MKLFLLPIITVLILGFSISAYAHDSIEYYPEKNFIIDNNSIPEKNHISDAPAVITYGIISSPGPKDEARVIQAIDRAFEIWEEHNPSLSFEKISVEEIPNITVRWNMVASIFEGQAEYIAEAYIGLVTISIGNYNCEGRIIEYSSDYLTHITMHEVGHVLGLEHHPNENHLMYSPVDIVTDFEALGYNIPNEMDGYRFVHEESLSDLFTILDERLVDLDQREKTTSKKIDSAYSEDLRELADEYLSILIEQKYVTNIHKVVHKELECFDDHLPPIYPTIIPLFPTNAPTDLIAIPGDRMVTLSWTTPVLGPGDRVEQYGIHYSDNGGETWAGQRHNSLSTTAVISGLQNDVSYDFRVQAKSTEGVGPWSKIVSATPHEQSVNSDLP